MPTETITLAEPADREFCSAAMRHLTNPAGPVTIITKPGLAAVTTLRNLVYASDMTPVEINVVSAAMSDATLWAARRIDSAGEPVVLIVVDDGLNLPGAQEVRERAGDLAAHANVHQVFAVRVV